ncbi:MarR family winged helix-turn-helix transcriptional regulator [Thalassomonas viridans]|uniref:MarR family winged helix-turn-helix transcriptional regulator n=1 Tax=Thalassomonas viridans TaxID=137584 RepID=UPI0005E09B2E|nr:MarR family transcriptional regulator [Thalassomonas viridans]
MAKKQQLIESDLPVEQKMLGLIMCIAQEKQVEISRLLKPLDLSFTQLNLLHTLSKATEDELTVGQLKAALIDESPNVSRALNKLVEKGLVRKRRSEEDQRTVFISITPEGEKAHIQGDLNLAQLKSPINKQEAGQLYQLLLKL